MNGGIVQDVQLKVSMARRQPTFEQSVDPSSASWAATGEDALNNFIISGFLFAPIYGECIREQRSVSVRQVGEP